MQDRCACADSPSKRVSVADPVWPRLRHASWGRPAPMRVGGVRYTEHRRRRVPTARRLRGTEDMAREEKTISNNKKAFHEYFVEERFEAGLALTGNEVKSLR